MTSPVELINKAIIFHQQGNLGEAEAIYKKVLRVHTNNFDALHMLGIINAQRGSFEEAEKFLRKALSVDSKVAPCFHNYGTVLAKLKRFEDAVSSYNSAIKLAPNHAPIYSDCGHALFELNRYDEALVSYERTLSLSGNFFDAWNGRGNVLFKRKLYDEALGAYDKALALKPDFANAWLGRGNVFSDLKRYDEAFAAYDKALALKPDLEGAWLGRGNVFNELKRYDEAFAVYDKALSLKPDLADAWLGRGNVFSELKRYDEAFAAYDKALALKPDLTYAEGARLHSKMQLCDWSNFDAESAHLISSVRSGTPTIPFSLLAICSSLEDQLQNATLYTAKECPLFEKPIWQGERYDHDKIRVAYLSADFREHPVSFLMTGIFERHDKSRFDVTGISLGPDDNSEIRQRLKATFERFIDAKTFSDEQIANLVRSSEVDILVDLMGFTAGARTGVFARRPAPIQVNYLGYAGTMGAKYIDYIIADYFVIPENKREFYMEKVIHSPNSFMINDSKRKISDRTPSRAECELPETAFVFCSFNQNYKITPLSFEIWMRLLRQLDNSVLWLSNTNETANRNLRREAQNCGVDPSRIIFAKRVPLNEDHLARNRLADLFLDTLPYNAHTTASDALWAGLPVLTCLGETFAGRVAASLLNAIHLPELITTTLEAYEQMAIDLATHPEKLAAIKHKLSENRLTTPLFDTKLFTKHIEAAYTMMYERHQAGLSPDHIVVPN